jgi:hypothetical protein
MQAPLPTGEGVTWKEMMLPAETHRSLISLLFDESRRPYYVLDTLKSLATEIFICEREGSQPEFCFVPQVVVTGLGPPFRFGLQAEMSLSKEAQTLIDEFLLAHELCWSSGAPMRSD